MWLAYLLGKDTFIATNFVLCPGISGRKVLCLRVPGSRSHGPELQVSGPGSQVLILDYALKNTKNI